MHRLKSLNQDESTTKPVASSLASSELLRIPSPMFLLHLSILNGFHSRDDFPMLVDLNVLYAGVDANPQPRRHLIFVSSEMLSRLSV